MIATTHEHRFLRLSTCCITNFMWIIKNLKRARDVLNECFLSATTSTKPPDLIALDCAINVTNENETRLVPDGAEQKEPPVADDAHVTEKV